MQCTARFLVRHEFVNSRGQQCFTEDPVELVLDVPDDVEAYYEAARNADRLSRQFMPDVPDTLTVVLESIKGPSGDIDVCEAAKTVIANNGRWTTASEREAVYNRFFPHGKLELTKSMKP